jgi:hypothetical protein
LGVVGAIRTVAVYGFAHVEFGHSIRLN